MRYCSRRRCDRCRAQPRRAATRAAERDPAPFSLIRIAVVPIMLGGLLALVFGLWLVHEADYGYGETWIVLALVLFVLANALGGVGGRRDERTARLAQQLAASGDAPSAELRARVRDPISLALSYGSGLILVALLATVAIVGFASRSRDEHAALLSQVGLWTFLLGIVPGWILMRAGAQWIVDKEFPNGANTPGWVDVGFIGSEPGGALLIVLGIIAWLWKRRGGTGAPALVVSLLATAYVLALGVAWFAMSGKPS